MNSANENNKAEHEILDKTADKESRAEEVAQKDKIDTVVNEEKEAESSDKDNAEEFISEFAPEPIKIPNYNKNKALAKHERANLKKKKKGSKKNKKRRAMLRKIVAGVRTVFLFLLLLTVIVTTLMVVVVKMNTSEYAVEHAIRANEPERFIIGAIKNYGEINLKHSSKNASIADILRDNSMIIVTYKDIEQAVLKSSYPEYIAKKTHDVLNYYLYAKPYKKITADEVSELLLDNVAYIKLVTGQELGDTACDAIAKRVVKSPAAKEIAQIALDKQPMSKFTHITSILLSMSALTVFVIALLLLLVLTVIFCNGFAHKIIGWTCMIGGALMCAFVPISKFLLNPMYKPATDFVRGIVNAIRSGFESSVLIYGAITLLIGLLVILVGHAMADNYDEEENSAEDGYIDEIEQVPTAQ